MHHCFKIGAVCFLVAKRVPESLLIVELRIVGRQVVNIQVQIVGKETFHSGAFMPGSIVGPKVDDHVFEPRYNFGEHFKKPVCVSTHPFHNSMEPIKRIDPAEKIETFMVPAFRVHIRLCAFLSPEARELRVSTGIENLPLSGIEFLPPSSKNESLFDGKSLKLHAHRAA